jgi:hypothetical protein
MSRFLTRLNMELMCDERDMPLCNRDGRQLFQLLCDFVYQSDVAGLITVPAGFVTDLASLPQCVLGIFGEIAQQPSIPHDFAYSKGVMPRATADAMLYEACILTGVPAWKAKLIYAGVRIGGGSHWTPAPAAATSITVSP